MSWVRLGLVGALALGVLGSGGAATLAQDAATAPFQTGIFAGTCVDLGQASDAQFQLASAAYGASSAAAATPGAAGVSGSPVGPADAIPVAVSVTHLDASIPDLTDQPHAVAAFSADGGGGQVALACGPIGGTANGSDLVFGLMPQNDSGYAGIGWLSAGGGSGVTVTVFLTSLARTGATVGGGEGTAATPAVASTQAVGTPAAAGSPAPSAPQAVTIEAVDIDFIPAEVTIPASTDVVELPNDGQILHNFSITDHKNPNVPNLGISVNIDPGATGRVTVNAPPGDYYYYCNIPGHEAAGMFGTLHVK